MQYSNRFMHIHFSFYGQNLRLFVLTSKSFPLAFFLSCKTSFILVRKTGTASAKVLRPQCGWKPRDSPLRVVISLQFKWWGEEATPFLTQQPTRDTHCIALTSTILPCYVTLASHPPVRRHPPASHPSHSGWLTKRCFVRVQRLVFVREKIDK